MKKLRSHTTELKHYEERKPYLAVLRDNKKIRDHSDHEVEHRNSALIKGIKATLGIPIYDSDDDRMMQTLAVDKYITEQLGRFTYEEIHEAFNMALRGEFEGMKQWGSYQIFPKLDCVLLAKVMNCYQEKRNERLRVYDQKQKMLAEPKQEISDAEKERIIKQGVERCFDEYIENEEITHGNNHIFDYLESRNMINKDKDYRLKLWRVCKSKRNAIDRNSVGETLRYLENKNQMLQSEKRAASITIYKKALLKDFFDSVISEGKHIRELI